MAATCERYSGPLSVRTLTYFPRQNRAAERLFMFNIVTGPQQTSKMQGQMRVLTTLTLQPVKLITLASTPADWQGLQNSTLEQMHPARKVA